MDDLKVEVHDPPLAAIALPDRGIAVPLPVRFECHDPVLPGIKISGELGGDPNRGEVTVDRLVLHRLPDGPTIDSETLKKLPLGPIVTAIIGKVCVEWDEHHANYLPVGRIAALRPSDVATFRGLKRSSKSLAASLAEVAEVYNSALFAPTQAVADHFEWSRSTASRRIRECRDKGLIEEATNEA